MGASILFALVDVITQQFAKTSGVAFYQPLMFLVLAAMTPLLGNAPPTPPAARKELLLGSTIIASRHH